MVGLLSTCMPVMVVSITIPFFSPKSVFYTPESCDGLPGIQNMRELLYVAVSGWKGVVFERLVNVTKGSLIEFMCSWCCCTRWRQIYCMYMYIVFVGSRSTTWQCTRSHSLPWIVLWCHTTLLSPTTSLHKHCRVNLRALFIAGSHDSLESAWVDLRSTWKAPVPVQCRWTFLTGVTLGRKYRV